MGVNKRGFVHRQSEEHRKGGDRAMGFAAMSPERHKELRLLGVASTQARVATKIASPTKTCTKCNVEKPKSEYHKDKQKSDGLRPTCKECTNAHINAHNLANPEKNRAKVKAWRDANRERSRKQRAEHRRKNQEQFRQRDAEYRAKNKELCLIHSRNRRARKRAAYGALSPDIVQKLYVLQRGKCPCCGKPLGKNYHLDHIVPLVDGGSNTDDNVQLLRAKCNLQKNRKHPVDFMRERGFLL